MKVKYPKTYSYLKHFEKELRSRAAYVRYYNSSDPFYSMFDVGDYTLAKVKVVWSRLAASMGASVISQDKEGKLLIPQETISFIGLDDEDEAHFICSVLNCSPFNFAVQSYSMRGGKSFGTPSILENVRVPKFNPKDKIHQDLSSFSQQAHASAAENNNIGVKEIEAQIDIAASQLWGLTKEELKEIQESLEEIQ